MATTYGMEIAGLHRELPICEAGEHLDIAAFIMFNDVEITVESAKQLLAKCPDFDYLVTAEAKGIPLAYEMARQSGKSYFVARKGTKLYMSEPFGVEVKSITTDRVQHLYLDKKEADEMSGKRVLIVDDVISTGESLKALETLLSNANCNVVGKAAVLAEGDAAERTDIYFLEPLPLFFK